MRKEAPPPKTTLTVEHERDSSFRYLYVNNVEVRASFFDVQIILGQIQRAEANKLHVLDHAVMYMSVEHARSLQRLLAAQLDAYEEQFGEIRSVPNEPA